MQSQKTFQLDLLVAFYLGHQDQSAKTSKNKIHVKILPMSVAKTIWVFLYYLLLLFIAFSVSYPVADDRYAL